MFPTENSKYKVRFGIYECPFCGSQFKTRYDSIKSGLTQSCGCYQKIKASLSNKTHGDTSTRLYRIWSHIKGRTLNPSDKAYKDYGGRGIILCEDWKDDFVSFRDWALSNGYAEGLSIDRVNNDKGYYPDNCRWATNTIQSRNQRIREDNTTGFKGVNYNKRDKKYQAQIQVLKRRVSLGYFVSALEGARVYNNYIIENNLEGFILNNISELSIKE